jgi:hypothetical protein
MENSFYESERQRYFKLLTLSYSDEYPHRIFANVDKTLDLLNEIFELSSTEDGRGKILKIHP